jgi:hypothetical protein
MAAEISAKQNRERPNVEPAVSGLAAENRDIMFVGKANCYHTMDWYRNAQRLCSPNHVFFATDHIDSEGYDKIISDTDEVVDLYNIDWLLFRTQSKVGNIWRNLLKLMVIPVQVARLKRLAQKHPARICHAHSMYYMYLCWLAGLPFVGTPQGSEVLVRPHRSRLYKYFAVKSLLAAKHITVDSVGMQKGIMELCGRQAQVVQNGIDIQAIRPYAETTQPRTKVVSIRGFHPLYRINKIVEARAASSQKPDLIFTYPLWEENYRDEVKCDLGKHDLDLGRVMPKTRLYEILSDALLAISIPASDSSPRSVYEAIFCGCCVAATPASWINALPDDMRERLFIVDLEDKLWFDKAMAYAERITRVPYKPSDTALTLFDQAIAAKVIVNLFYGEESHGTSSK